jgi:CRP-like cAMP-binding protein
MRTKNLLHILEKAAPWFRTQDPLVRLENLKKYSENTYKKGDILHMPNDNITDLYLVVDGSIGVFTTEKLTNFNSDFLVLTKYDKCEFVNENIAMSNLKNPYGAMALSDSVTILIIKHHDFTAVVNEETIDLLKGNLSAKSNHLLAIWRKLKHVHPDRVQSLQDRYIKSNDVPLAGIRGKLDNAGALKNLRKFDAIVGIFLPLLTVFRQ